MTYVLHGASGCAVCRLPNTTKGDVLAVISDSIPVYDELGYVVDILIGRPFVKRFALSYRFVVCPVCPVCNVRALWLVSDIAICAEKGR